MLSQIIEPKHAKFQEKQIRPPGGVADTRFVYGHFKYKKGRNYVKK